MKKFLTLITLASFIIGCTTPDTPTGPRVKDQQSRVTSQNNSALSQGVPFDQINSNSTGSSEIIFPQASGEVPNYSDTKVGNNSVPENNINIPTGSMPVDNRKDIKSLADAVIPVEAAISATTSVATANINTTSIINQEQVQKIPETNSSIKILLADANKAVAENRLDRAASSLERAVRIEPNNAGIWYDLAQIKLHQADYTGSENYSKKAIGLAGEGSTIAKRSYKLISVGRKAQGDLTGAQEAETRSK